MGVYSYTTPARGGFKHCKTSWWCFCFGCDGQRTQLWRPTHG